jgi:hypothetical protein
MAEAGAPMVQVDLNAAEAAHFDAYASDSTKA